MISRLLTLLVALPVTVSGCGAPDEAFSNDRSQHGSTEHEVVRLDVPRIRPVEREDWTPEQRDYLEAHEQAGRLINVFKTSAHHVDLASAIDSLAFGHINSSSSTLSPRHRELLILRIGWLCRAEYEWAAHSYVARTIGLTDEEIARITQGAEAPGWDPFEATLLTAVDELHSDAFLTDETWQALRTKYDDRQIMDLIATVGTYNLVSMMLNSLGIQIDDGFTEFGFPSENPETSD